MPAVKDVHEPVMLAHFPRQFSLGLEALIVRDNRENLE